MPDHTLFPSILPDNDEPFVDDSYSRQELDRMERPELQSLAAKADIEGVNGQSSNEDIRDALEGHERL
jgi:hypothetical protein